MCAITKLSGCTFLLCAGHENGFPGAHRQCDRDALADLYFFRLDFVYQPGARAKFPCGTSDAGDLCRHCRPRNHEYDNRCDCPRCVYRSQPGGQTGKEIVGLKNTLYETKASIFQHIHSERFTEVKRKLAVPASEGYGCPFVFVALCLCVCESVYRTLELCTRGLLVFVCLQLHL